MKGGLRMNHIFKTTSAEAPLVSIVTVVLNGSAHLEQTIRSVLEQSYSPIEYIIVDGGSTDGTLDIIRKYESKIDYWQSEPDKGIYDAMNKGIALATGEIIGIINADDYYTPDAVQQVMDKRKSGNADLFYGDMLVLTGDTQSLMKPDITKMDEKPSIFHPSCFVSKKVYDAAGTFDTRYKISADYDFLLRCLKQKYRFSYVSHPLTVFRPGGMSASCASNIEGYHIMKVHHTGFHRQVIGRAIRCYVKTFLKKVIHLGKR